MTCHAVATSTQPDHFGAGSQRASNADGGVLDDDGSLDLDAQRAGSVQIEIGLRLAAIDMHGAAIDMRRKVLAKPEMVEVALDPLDRARRGDRLGHRRRQAPDEGYRAAD